MSPLMVQPPQPQMIQQIKMEDCENGEDCNSLLGQFAENWTLEQGWIAAKYRFIATGTILHQNFLFLLIYGMNLKSKSLQLNF